MANGAGAALIDLYRLGNSKVFDFSWIKQSPELRLRKYSAFIVINNVPFVEYLSRLGFSDQIIFIDGIQDWRAEEADPLRDQIQSPIYAYLVEKFINKPRFEEYPGIVKKVISRITWNGQYPCPDNLELSDRLILLHFGGIVSPVVPWVEVKDIVNGIFEEVKSCCEALGTQLVVIGSSEIGSLQKSTNNLVKIIPTASPSLAMHLFKNSLLTISTPGASAISQAVRSGAPLILLPPLNSTMIHHLKQSSSFGLASILSDSDLAEISQSIVESSSYWSQQSLVAVHWTKKNLNDLRCQLKETIQQLISKKSSARKKFITAQQTFLQQSRAS